MDTAAYFSRGLMAASTDSPFLLSTSAYLKRPAPARTGSRRPACAATPRGYPIVADVSTLGPILYPIWISPSWTRCSKPNAPGTLRWRPGFETGFVSAITRESLAGYGPDTVGGIFRDYLVRNNFEPEFKGGRGPMGKGLFSYYQLRLSQQHDLEHICGGFAFEYISEIGVTWMRMRNLFEHLSAELAGALSITYSLLMVPQLNRVILHYPQAFLPLWQNLQQGDLVGATSAPIS
ncbi:MAG: Coq4 family protein [Aliidongia sp.]